MIYLDKIIIIYINNNKIFITLSLSLSLSLSLFFFLLIYELKIQKKKKNILKRKMEFLFDCCFYAIFFPIQIMINLLEILLFRTLL